MSLSFSARRLGFSLAAGLLAFAMTSEVAHAQFRRFIGPPITVRTSPAFVNPALARGIFPSTGVVGPTNPYIMQARRDATNFTAYGQAVNSAYLNSIYGYHRSWFVNPYWSGPFYPAYPQPYYMQPYYPPYNYNTNYGSQSYSSYSPPPANAPAPPPAPRAAPAVGAFAVPTNDDGSIAWPFAFRLLAPDAKRELVDPLDTQLQLLSNQASAGRVNPAIVREARESVDRLYRWLRTHRLDLAEGSVRDANAFLGRVDGALRAMAPDA
jgi:hypothetical protein